MSGYEKRGFVRVDKRHPQEPQVEMLLAKGVRKDRISFDHDGEKIEDVIKGLRSGMELVVTTLDRLGGNRKVLRKRIVDVHAKGAFVVEAKTGRTTRKAKDALVMVLDAVDEVISGHRHLTPAEARRRGKRGGRPVNERMGEKQARSYWKDKTIKTNAEALEMMEGWSLMTAFRAFGGSGRDGKRGRPKKAVTKQKRR